MPRTLLLAVLALVLLGGVLRASAAPAPQLLTAPEVASYVMDVRLDPEAKQVAGTERITYRNPSGDTLDELWLRLYLRAFSSDDTIWMRESGGGHRGFSAGSANYGTIEVSELSLADGTDLLAHATITDTLMRVPLPDPLAPGEAVELDARWVSTLPRVFARTGYGGRDDTFFMVGQWYPKMAVYDRGQWDTEPWHANAEFFHDFGSYDVRITVPREYVVAGVGVPAGEREAPDGQKTVRFIAENVTDFAFAASPDFLTRSAPAAGAEVVLFYLPEHAAQVDQYLEVATGALEAFHAWYGPYPHPRLTVVDVPDDAAGAGGMEYPTLITGGTFGLPFDPGLLAMVVAHEVAHQWWPMQTATNEAREPWLDEGLTQYSGSRYMQASGRTIGFGPLAISAAASDRSQYAVAPNLPANLPAWAYGAGYASAAYSKPAVGLWSLERTVGSEAFFAAMARYLEQYRFRHPTSADFRNSLERSLDQDLSWFFDEYISGDGVIDYQAGRIENTSEGSRVWVMRTGEVRAPVDVRVTFASGAQRTHTWDGQSSITSFEFAPGDPVVQLEVDPERKLVAEIDLLDNGARVSAQVAPALTLGARIAFVMQALLQSLGLFG